VDAVQRQCLTPSTFAHVYTIKRHVLYIVFDLEVSSVKRKLSRYGNVDVLRDVVGLVKKVIDLNRHKFAFCS
jgi:hypothetical protein